MGTSARSIRVLYLWRRAARQAFKTRSARGRIDDGAPEMKVLSFKFWIFLPRGAARFVAKKRSARVTFAWFAGLLREAAGRG
jgi:hypothetical protein